MNTELLHNIFKLIICTYAFAIFSRFVHLKPFQEIYNYVSTSIVFYRLILCNYYRKLIYV